ncbi:hypothetical protein TNCV_1061091 [Trichonephila clavipes]|nr:hypothetical protein TNCV_1061091 [Trichonephila clavipes]
MLRFFFSFGNWCKGLVISQRSSQSAKLLLETYNQGFADYTQSVEAERPSYGKVWKFGLRVPAQVSSASFAPGSQLQNSLQLFLLNLVSSSESKLEQENLPAFDSFSESSRHKEAISLGLRPLSHRFRVSAIARCE